MNFHPLFERWQRAERVQTARQAFVLQQARGLGSVTVRRKKSQQKCDCPSKESLQLQSRFVRIILRKEPMSNREEISFRLAPHMYYVQTEGTQWLRYLRVFEFSDSMALFGSLAARQTSLDDLEAMLDGAGDRLVIRESTNSRRQAILNLFESGVSKEGEHHVLELNYCKVDSPVQSEIEERRRWLATQNDGVTSLHEFAFIQFSDVEFLKEQLK